MRFSEVLAASLVAPLVAAHGSIQGAPKLFGLPNDVKIRNPTPRAARAAAQGPHHLIARQGGDSSNRCGPQGGNAVCAQGYCCSGAGYCGNTPAHCNAPDCLFNFGPGCDANKTPAGASTRNDPRPQKGSVRYGGAGVYNCLKPGTVAITYDDGPYVYTDEVLNKFAAAGFKATFFVTGINLGKGAIDEQWRGVIQRMVAEGHQVASHTWSHQDLSAITEAQVYDQMVKNEMAIRNIIGKYPTYMRPPYSSCSGTCQNVMQKLGYVISYFDLDTDDYNNLTPEKIENAKNNFRNAMSTVSPGNDDKLAIAHDIHELTALNLTVTMIETLQARGFKGVTMGECMNEPEANWYRDSTPGTAPSSSTRSSSTRSSSTRVSSTAGSTSTPTGAVSIDGTCGGTKGYKCTGSSFGNCCSQYGWCGSSSDHCGTGCNPLLGNCGSNTNPSSTRASSTSSARASSTRASSASSARASSTRASSASSARASSATSSSAPKPTGALKASTDGSCGASSGFTCVGFTLDGAKAECCSQYGYCGNSTAYCGTGCNPLAGKCGSVSSSVSSSVAHSSSAPIPSDKHDSTPSTSLTAVHTPSTTPSVSTSKSGDKSSTVSSVHPDSTHAYESSTFSSVYPSSSSVESDKHYPSTISSDYVPTNPSQTSSVFVDDYPTASSSAEYTTSSTPTPTPTQPVSKDGKCGGELGQTCAGYKNNFGLKLECCYKLTGRCSSSPWACGLGCDKKSGKCWY